MYSPEPSPTIAVSAKRPRGRRRYTCGHELGHHIFGHGTRLDELIDETAEEWSPEEFMAQRFAAALLMPKLAVESAFAKRGWPIMQPKPVMIFTIAQELGVGYTTLVGHLERTLRCLPRTAADALRGVRLSQLRKQLAGFAVERDLLIVDQNWACRTIDVEVGDIVILPKDANAEGECASLAETPVRHALAVAPGIGRVTTHADRPSASLRVSRREFTGLARYRHLEEVADDE
jgi:hypothetical protein